MLFGIHCDDIQILTFLAVVLSLTQGVPNILKELIQSSTRAMDCEIVMLCSRVIHVLCTVITTTTTTTTVLRPFVRDYPGESVPER